MKCVVSVSVSQRSVMRPVVGGFVSLHHIVLLLNLSHYSSRVLNIVCVGHTHTHTHTPLLCNINLKFQHRERFA